MPQVGYQRTPPISLLYRGCSSQLGDSVFDMKRCYSFMRRKRTCRSEKRETARSIDRGLWCTEVGGGRGDAGRMTVGRGG